MVDARDGDPSDAEADGHDPRRWVREQRPQRRRDQRHVAGRDHPQGGLVHASPYIVSVVVALHVVLDRGPQAGHLSPQRLVVRRLRQVLLDHGGGGRRIGRGDRLLERTAVAVQRDDIAAGGPAASSAPEQQCDDGGGDECSGDGAPDADTCCGTRTY